MVKSPMEYFQEQDFSMDPASGQDLNPTERAFLKKYLGVDDVSAVQGMRAVEGRPVLGQALDAARSVPVAPAPGVPGQGVAVSQKPDALTKTAAASADAGEPTAQENVIGGWSGPLLDDLLREMSQVSLVGFYVTGDVFVIPIDAVLEVIRYEPPQRLPMAPPYLPGVVNLRGRILPVVDLEALLIEPEHRRSEPARNRLIIICEAKGLQMGLLIDRLHTIFKVEQKDINWNAEAHLGPSAELLSGLMETGEKLLGIVSVDRLVDKLLEA